MNIAFIIPGDIETPTGGYRYDRRILAEWQKTGKCHQLFSLSGNFPFPDADARLAALALTSKIAQHDVVVIDGLAGGCMPEFIEELSRHIPVVALIHHPLFLENGLTPKEAQLLEIQERQGLDHVRRVITTSRETARTVGRIFDFPTNPISTVLPGVDRGELSQPAPDGPVKLLCVASIVERKGHRYLLEALAGLKNLPWELDLVGLGGLDPALEASLHTFVESEELGDRIRFFGPATEPQLAAAYNQAHIFVLPSLYEGYGMAYAEAITRGIPVIGTNAGAIPDTVPSGCGILVPPENAAKLAEALEMLITDGETRGQYRKNAIAAEPFFPTWESSAQEFSGILEGLV